VLLGAALGVLALALIASLAVFPVQTFLSQGDEIDRLADELARLESVNAELAAEVARLRTDEGVREAARDQLGYVGEDERRETIVPADAPPTDLPAGWPYGPVGRIIELRLGAP
jgi:cell division protein FtsB